MSKATILHADLDAFYASVEQRDDPRLRGRPVIVGAGVVLAASYEAKAHGVRTAMGGVQARRLCPRAVVVPPRMGVYAKASKDVITISPDATVRELSRRYRVDMPITDAVFAILFEGKDVFQALTELMTREPKPERTD